MRAVLAFSCALSLAAHAQDLADLHVHLTMHDGLALVGDDGLQRLATNSADQLRSQLTPFGLSRAGVGVVIAALWIPPNRPGRTPMDELRHQVEALERFSQRHPQFAVVRSVAEAERARHVGRIAVFIGIEGADAIARVEDVDVAYGLGVRVMSLAHFVDTPLLDAEDGQFGGALRPFLDGSTQGVTQLGLAVAERAIRRGLLIDVTHASPLAVEHLLALHERLHAPLIASHVGSSMLTPRTLSDEHARAIVALGGVLGIGLFRHPLLQPVPTADQFPGFVAGTCDEAIAHQRHFAALVGEEHVMLGSDLGAPILRAAPGGSCAEGVRTDADLPVLLAALRAQGAKLETSAQRLLSLLEHEEQRRHE